MVEVQPDFESEDWSLIRDALVARGKSVEEAVGILQTAWWKQHRRKLDAWNGHLKSQRLDHPSKKSIPLAPIAPPAPDNSKPGRFDRLTPNFIDIRPVCHILRKLEEKEYVDLWYFTAQGCRDAVSPASRSKITRDEHLSYELWLEGKTRLLRCMREHGWSLCETDELAKFFLNLDIHPMKSQLYGLQAMLRYQERVR